MSVSLIQHEKIHTTLSRAKELRRMLEPIITLAKRDSVAARRRAFAKLRDKVAVRKLFTDLGPHYRERPGGYLRILKHGFRKGDNAPMAYVCLVDRPEPTAEETKESSKSETKAKGEPSPAANSDRRRGIA